MLLNCFLIQRGIILPVHVMFFVYLSLSLRLDLFVFYILYMYSTFLFSFITINRIISLKQTNVSFGHVAQKFSLRVSLSFCLIFYQFQPGVAYKSVAYVEKSLYLTMINNLQLPQSACKEKKMMLTLGMRLKTESLLMLEFFLPYNF